MMEGSVDMAKALSGMIGEDADDMPKKPIDVPVEHLDYAYVEKCEDVRELKAILAILESGKEGRYPELERFTEKRMLSLMPAKDRKQYIALKSEPTLKDQDEARTIAESFVKDMGSIAAEVEAEKHGKSAMPRVSRNLPPVRGKKAPAPDSEGPAAARPSPATAAATGAKRKADPRKGTFKEYYDKWDRFDVDKEVEAVEVEEAKAREAVEAENARIAAEAKANLEKRKREIKRLKMKADPESMSTLERNRLGVREKLKGNEAFTAGDNEDAILAYSRSLMYLPGNHIVLANRGLVRMKVNRLATAEEDFDASLAAEPTYFKAWLRRGNVRHKRGKYIYAIQDFDKCLELDPSSKEAVKLRKLAMSKLREVEGDDADAILAGEKPPTTGTGPAPSSESTSRVEFLDSDESDVEEVEAEPAPAAKPASTASRRIVIEEDSSDESESDEDTKLSMSTSAHTEEKKGEGSSRRIAIEESESEDDDEEEADGTTRAVAAASQGAAARAAAALAATSTGGDSSDDEDSEDDAGAASKPVSKKRVAIEESSDEDSSDEEETAPAAAASPMAAPEPTPTPVSAPTRAPASTPAVEKEEDGEEDGLVVTVGKTAEQLRIQGNDQFKKGDIDGAIESYTSAVGKDPNALSARSNLAAVYLKRNMFAEAVAQCSEVLKRADSKDKATAVKVLYRRGMGYKGLGKYPSALADMKAALALEPQNKRVAMEAQAIDQVLRTKSKTVAAPAPVEASPPKPAKPSVSFAPSTSKSKPTPKAKAGKASVPRTPEVAEIKEADAALPALSPAAADKSARMERAKAAASGATSILSTRMKIPDQPRSALEFERACSRLREHPSVFVDYLKSLELSKVQKLFKRPVDSITITHLVAITSTMVAESANAGRGVAVLRLLTRTPDFDTVVLMMENSEKTVVRKTLEAASKHSVSASRIAAVSKAFEL